MDESPKLTASDLSPQKTSLTSQDFDADRLKSSLREAEYRLVQSKEHSALKEQQLEDAREELERSRRHIENQAKVLQSQGQELLDAKARLEEALRAKKYEGEEARPLAFQTQIRERDEEIERLRVLLSTKEDSLENAVTRHDTARQKLLDTSLDLQQRDKEIQSLRKELAASRRSTDESMLLRRGEGPLMVQVEHLKADNERLVKLLKSTKEFRDFSEFAGSMSGFVAVPPPPAEADEWVPFDAFSLAHEFFANNPGETTERKVNLLLTKLNQIWREREKAQITRIKMSCAREVEDLRRQLAMKDPTSQVQAQTDAERLRGDLQLAYKQMRENISSGASANRAAARPASATPRMVSDLRKKVQTLTSENTRLQALKTPAKPESSKMDFYDGAAWISQRLQREVEKLKEAISARVTELLRGLQDCQTSLTHRRQQEKLLVTCTQEEVDSKVKEFQSKIDQVVEKTIKEQRLTST